MDNTKQIKTPEQWLIDEGYPVSMPITRDTMANIIHKYNQQHPVADASQPAGNGWVSEKPDFNKECLFVAAYEINGLYEYDVYQIKKLWVDNQWYFAWLDRNGEEYGDIADISADKYLMLNPPHTP